MANMKLLFPNLCDLAAVSDGAWRDGDLGLEALHDTAIGHVARSMNAAPSSTVMQWVLDRPHDFGAIAILGHNMTTAATVVATIAFDETFTQIAFSNADQPADAFPAVNRTRDLPWTHPNWFSGRPTQDEIGRTITAATIVLPKAANGKVLRIQIFDPANPDGYVEVGRIMFGPVVEFGQNYAYGAALSVQDESRRTQSLGGSRFFDKRGKRRRMTFGFDTLDEEQAFAKLFDLTADAGMTEEVFVMPDVDDRLNMQRRSFRGHLTEPSQLEQVVFRRMNAAFQVEELI